MLTRVYSGLYGGKNVSSFAGKPTSSASHPVGKITRVYSGLYGGRRNGDFSSKTQTSGGSMRLLMNGMRHFRPWF